MYGLYGFFSKIVRIVRIFFRKLYELYGLLLKMYGFFQKKNFGHPVMSFWQPFVFFLFQPNLKLPNVQNFLSNTNPYYYFDTNTGQIISN